MIIILKYQNPPVQHMYRHTHMTYGICLVYIVDVGMFVYV